MTTPYDRKILLVNWRGRTTPGNTIDDTAVLIREKMPNVAGVMLKTSNGVSWQGHLGNDHDLKAVTGVRRIEEWVAAFDRQGLEVHVWGVPRAKTRIIGGISPDLDREAEKFAKAANVPGVRSLLLDVEHGQFYWQGAMQEVHELMNRIRQQVNDDTHIGMIVDGRRNRPFSVWVDPWIPFVNSLHPMVYPILFGDFKSIEQHLDDAFTSLGGYNKPIVPMLQSTADMPRRPTKAEITRQGEAAWLRGAAGISFYRLGSTDWGGDHLPHMGEPEYSGVAAIRIPGQEVGEPEPDYTWQDVINAAVTVAIRVQGSWDQWLTDAGFWGRFQNSLRPLPYSGPPIADWPLPDEHRRQIAELLQLESSELIRVTTDTQGEQERRDKETSTRHQAARGSIIGIHGAPGAAAPPSQTWDMWIERLQEMGVGWYKQCDHGDPNDTGPHSIFAWAKRLKQAGIEPIIRYLMSEQFPDSLPDPHFQKMQLFAQEGILWAEIGNEPNLEIEWKREWQTRNGVTPMRHTNPDAIRQVAETWVRDARMALNAGVQPAFYAFAPTDWRGGSHPLYSSVFYTRKVVAHLATHHRAATMDIFRRGGWIAVHAATYEQPVDFDTHRPDGTIWDMTLRSYEVVLEAFREHFGADLDVDSIPVMSTEGGVFTPDSSSMNGHIRLNTDEEHSQRVVEMFRWLDRHSPLQAMTPWCLSVGGFIGHFHAPFQFDGWIEEANGQLIPRAVYEAMRQLRFDQERELEEVEETHDLIKLDVPYISQFDLTAVSHSADCGPTCLAMILNAQRPSAQQVTVDEMYARSLLLREKKFNEFTGIHEMQRVSRDEGMELRRQDFANGAAALQGLKELVEQEVPFVALVNYNETWNAIVKEHHYRGGHFVVVTGFDDAHVFVHDPLFRGSNRHKGEFFVWRNDKFLSGWGSGTEIDNPNFTALIPDKRVSRLA